MSRGSGPGPPSVGGRCESDDRYADLGPASSGVADRWAEVSASKIAAGCNAAAALATAASAAAAARQYSSGSDRVDSTSLLALAASLEDAFLAVMNQRSNVR